VPVVVGVAEIRSDAITVKLKLVDAELLLFLTVSEIVTTPEELAGGVIVSTQFGAVPERIMPVGGVTL